MMVHDADGNELGELPLSDKQQEALSGGGAISVLFHTPQLLHSVLGIHSGKFDLYMDDDRLMTDTPDAFKGYVALRKAAKREAN